MDMDYSADEVRYSVMSLNNYLHSLQELRAVESWEEVIGRIFHEDHVLAFRPYPDIEDLIRETTRRLMELLLCHPGCASKDTVGRIIKVHCWFMFRPQEHQRWREDKEASFVLFQGVLLDGKVKKIGINGSYMLKEYLRNNFKRYDSRFMRAIVTYGLAIPVDMDHSMFVSVCLSCRPFRWSFSKTVDWMYLSLMYETLRRKDGCTSDRNRRGFGRIFGVVQALYATSLALRGRVSSAENHARFLETYWDTLPDPLVSGEEIREFLLFAESENFGKTRKICDALAIADHREHVLEAALQRGRVVLDADRAVEAFVGLFGQRAYEPRRLSHLCRCAARSALVQNSPLTLPASVQRLHLPESIKNFILCNPEWRSE